MSRLVPVCAASVLLVASPALAHTGLEPHLHGFDMGLTHPLMGMDHVFAMLSVGLWARFVAGRAVWAWPLAFLGFMALGGALGMAGFDLPMVESGIALSVLVLGAALAFDIRPTVSVGAILCGLFALCHGVSHGSEMPLDAAGFAYGLGFLTGTTLLLGAGLALGATLHRLAPQWIRLSGLGVATLGLSYLAA